jgi:hypothetical protein
MTPRNPRQTTPRQPTSSTESDRASDAFDGSSSQADGAADARERVADAAKRQAESLYRDASSSAAEASAAIGDAAATLESSGHETLSQAAAALSDRVRTFSTYLEDRSLEDLVGDARRLAQRNPGLFIAGGVALGFALSRFLKASSADAGRAARNMS